MYFYKIFLVKVLINTYLKLVSNNARKYYITLYVQRNISELMKDHLHDTIAFRNIWST